MNMSNTYRMMGDMKTAEFYAKKSAVIQSKQKD